MAQEAKSISCEEVAEGTILFRFTKPVDFSYRAGQSIDLTIPLMSMPDPRGNMRPFTLASAPHDDHLFITTRVRGSGFKETLKTLPEGSTLLIDGPFGDLTLHEQASRPAVFLAGGIGVTPFYSIISEATFQALPHKMVLFYSNRRPEDTPFLAELVDMERRNEHFTLVATMTEMEQSKEEWEGARGYIEVSMVQKHVSLEERPLFYVAGPSGMVGAMCSMLNEMGISNDDIRTEAFTGY